MLSLKIGRTRSLFTKLLKSAAFSCKGSIGVKGSLMGFKGVKKGSKGVQEGFKVA